MQSYEFTYIINPDLPTEELNSLVGRVKSIIEKEGGNISRINPPLKKKLAYRIKKRGEAFLADISFELNNDKLKQLEEKLRTEKNVLRYLIIKKVEKTAPKVRTRVRPKPKTKVELKEIEQKLEEILGE